MKEKVDMKGVGQQRDEVTKEAEFLEKGNCTEGRITCKKTVRRQG